MKPTFFRTVIVISFFLSAIAEALTPSVQKLIEFETQANGAATRSAEMTLLPHVEIPLNLVGLQFAERLDPRIRESLVFELDGVKMVRWILNPEDTKWGEELIRHYQQKHQLNLEKKYYFHGYQTSSRSYIAEDPRSGVQFSVKSSTNVAGGLWRDKKQPVGEALDSRMMSDYLYGQNKKRPFQYFIIMDEPAVLTNPELDQAVVIRDLNEIKNTDSQKYYMPGFSALHEQVGREIARINGSSDPYLFWTENYVKVAGRALGELAARTGLQFDSPHSQNFLIELTQDLKPTGRLVLRDMADLYIDQNFMRALEGEDSKTLKRFSQKENILNYTSAGFGPLHGNKYPHWITKEQYTGWKDVFFNEFEAVFRSVSGVNISAKKVSRLQSRDYFLATYPTQEILGVTDFFQSLSRRGLVHGVAKLRCGPIFSY